MLKTQLLRLSDVLLKRATLGFAKIALTRCSTWACGVWHCLRAIAIVRISISSGSVVYRSGRRVSS